MEKKEIIKKMRDIRDSVDGSFIPPKHYIRKYCKAGSITCGRAWINWFIDRMEKVL